MDVVVHSSRICTSLNQFESAMTASHYKISRSSWQSHCARIRTTRGYIFAFVSNQSGDSMERQTCHQGCNAAAPRDGLSSSHSAYVCHASPVTRQPQRLLLQFRSRHQPRLRSLPSMQLGGNIAGLSGTLGLFKESHNHDSSMHHPCGFKMSQSRASTVPVPPAPDAFLAVKFRRIAYH